jgi:hypothetical protein
MQRLEGERRAVVARCAGDQHLRRALDAASKHALPHKLLRCLCSHTEQVTPSPLDRCRSLRSQQRCYWLEGKKLAAQVMHIMLGTVLHERTYEAEHCGAKMN